MIENLSLPFAQFYISLPRTFARWIQLSYSGFRILAHQHTQFYIHTSDIPIMIPKLILQIYPLPLERVKIGSLITDPLHPNEDAQNGSTPLSLETDCSVSRTGPWLEASNDSSNTSIVVKLLGYLFADLRYSATSTQKIGADNTCTYELNNPKNRFKDLTSQEGVQSWIQAQVEEGNTIHLITGIQTTLNQRVEASGNSKLSGSGSLSPGPYTSLIGKAVNADDSELNASHSRTHNTERFLSTEGERVVAVRIRRVLVKEANGATLDQKNRSIWNMVGDNRAAVSVEQLVEAILQEEDDDCGGTTEVLNTGDGDKKLVYVALKGSDNNLN